jgi:8-oxo-dGTP diphosphatase
MTQQNNYCLGFLFDITGERVVLIKKSKPPWQRNRLNGIGGHIEESEFASDAMCREVHEEAGLRIIDWQDVCQLHGEWGTIYVFASYFDAIEIVTSKTPETVHIFKVSELPDCVIPNVRWMIQMALSLRLGENTRCFSVHEMWPV